MALEENPACGDNELMSSAVAIAVPKPVQKNIIPKAFVQKKTGLALWMERVLEECDHASIGFTADPVHDLRVALRRCRSLADGLMAMDPDPEWKRMKKAGKRLFSRLGELRDVQVMEEWVQRLATPEDLEAQVLLRSFANREIQLKQEAASALGEFDRKQWKKWSTTLPRRGAKLRTGTVLFKHLALEKWNAAYDLHRLALRNRSKVAFHSLRIGLKRFRYIVENFLPEQHKIWKDDLKELQDLLGEVHDLDVLWTAALEVNAFPDIESRLRWQKKIAEERGARIAKYRAKMLGKNSLWQVWRAALPGGEQVESAALQRIKLWASYLDPDFKHSDHITKLAMQIYDALLRNGRWSSTEDSGERIILQIAAFVHDVGRSRNQKNPHKLSFKLTCELAPPLGITKETLKMAGVVARYHAGSLPRIGQKTLLGLTQSQRQTVNRLSGILRLAEAFDADHGGRIQTLTVQEHTGFVLIFAEGYSARDPLAEKVAAARHLLEIVLRRPVLVKPLIAKRKKPAMITRS
ncbi:MAG TPA: CHAD domain-containing protein [Terriglobales bacterium]|nr:CHAD domain-containing protein [Terriglobales bacterium]